MAQAKRTATAAKQKRAPAKKRKSTRSAPRIPIFRILIYVLVLMFFMFTVGVILYVVFFQVVVAGLPGTMLNPELSLFS